VFTRDYDYKLPPELIAQEPARERDASRLLVVNRHSGSIVHDIFSHIGQYLQPGDVLVANRSRVIPARLHAYRPTGGHVELLLLRAYGHDKWHALARPSRKLSPGLLLSFEGASLQALVGQPRGGGEWEIHFGGTDDIAAALRQVGALALPPYIRNQDVSGDRYQTVYADREGSIAAGLAHSGP
jgi:S-adenosylmethionine:tRNA ribosyltransferase-isomerase